MVYNEQPTIIVIDDDINSLKSTSELLKIKDWNVVTHLTSIDALRNIETTKPDAAIIDFFLPDTTGVELMKKLHFQYPDLPVVILTGSRDVQTAIESLKAGAYHYLLKPLQADELFSTVDKIKSRLTLEKENKRLKGELANRYGFENIVGNSPKLASIFKMLQKATKTKSSILITGESGTGKELFAKAVHYSSPRAGGPFIKVNCAAIPETMLEAELFGIEKNVATGVDKRAGKFQLADGGSIFLDEIGDMPLSTQSKILRVLQEREVEPVGALAPIPVDIRVIAATNRNLEEAVAEKNFRQDLLYRLNVFHLHIPPLSERRVDIPVLAEHFIEKYSEENGLLEKRIDEDGLKHLSERSWPGNIRELENVIERAVAVSEGHDIGLSDLNINGDDFAPEQPEKFDMENSSLESSVEEFERKLIVKALEDSNWRQKKAAMALGISERSIWYKIKKLKIEIKKTG